MKRDLTEEEWLDIRTALLAASLQCDSVIKTAIAGENTDVARKKRNDFLKLADKIAS